MLRSLLPLALLALFPIPYAIERAPRLGKAPVTLALVAANVLVFLKSGFTLQGFAQPTLLFETQGLTPAVIHPINLVTYLFLHVSFGHLAANMLVLYLFGSAVEKRIGSLLFAMLYLFCGIAAGLLDCRIVMHYLPHASVAYQPLVGASGAISGIVGLFAVYGMGRSLKLFWPVGLLLGRGWHLLEIPSGVGVALWLVGEVYGAAASLHSADGGGIAYFAHLGGFAFGLACGVAGGLMRRIRRRDDEMLLLPSPPSRAATAAPKPGKQAPAGTATAGMVDLLRRSVEERDYDRASALYSKCRGIGAPIPPDLLDALGKLAAESGRPDTAAQLRAQAAGLPPV